MPNRILKESICESRGLSEVSIFAEDLYKRLITYADDYGRFNADFKIIRARLYPREIEIVSDEDIEDAMTELVGVGKIAFYTSEARHDLYGCFPNWKDHQRVRELKAKIPLPDDTSINDYYLRRFIPIDMKIRIIERDKRKCKLCGKQVASESCSADRLAKMCAGMFHFDHIVPVNMGGRATEENLRLLCPKCNLSRKKSFSIAEIISITQKSAANCGELPPESNPIQSESESNPNTNIRAHADEVFESFYARYPRHVDKADARKAWAKLKDAEYDSVIAGLEKWIPYFNGEEEQFIPHPATWLNKRRWESEPPKVKKQNAALKYAQTPIPEDNFNAMVVDLTGGDYESC